MAFRTLLSKRGCISPILNSLPLRTVSSVVVHRALPALAPRGSSRPISSGSDHWTPPPPPKDAQKIDPETLLPGCDFKHWLVFIDPPPENTSRADIIDGYVKMLAQAIGSEEEAKMKIYSVSTRYYYAFGAVIPREVCDKLKQMPGVQWVLPDSYLHPKTKDYGGEPFINGEAVPYDPKYHEVWLRNRQNQGQNERRKFGRPRWDRQSQEHQDRPHPSQVSRTG